MKRILFGLMLTVTAVTNALAQSSDVMMQAFNWNSATNTTGWYNVVNSKVADMKAGGINTIWLPPPGTSASREGYLPAEYYNLYSSYGSQAQLQTLIGNLHTNNMKALADIVINHRVGKTGWADFQNPTWGCWAVCNNDEWTGRCGGNDTGDGYSAARDIDHTNSQVRTDITAWLQWLKGTIGFDGWRYDYVKGFNGYYVKLYNDATTPYFSVGELWDPNRQNIQNWVDATQQTSAAFDFATKGILQDALNNNSFGPLNAGGSAGGLIGWSPAKSVTFLDNHDTGSSQNLWPFPGTKVLQGYAYILTHPGIPMIFWDHYFDWGHKTAIDAMIKIRKDNALKSTSSLNIVSAGSGLYAAIIDNKVAMKIGPNSWSPGAGWILKASGTDYAIWDKITPPQTPVVTCTPAGGSYSATQNVVLTATDGSGTAPTIYYTLDGTTPSTTSTSAVGTVTIPITVSKTLKYFARNAGGLTSTPTTQVYTITIVTDAIPPVLSVSPAGPYSGAATTVTLSATDNSGAVPTIYYTTDGTTPSLLSTSAVSPISLSVASSKTIKAFARDGSNNISATQSHVYTISATNPPTGFTVYFKKPTTWTSAWIHYWNALPAGNLANCVWPCTQMTQHSTNWFKYSFTNINSTSLLFHNNAGVQTANLTRSSLGSYDHATATWINTVPPPETPVTTFVMDGALDASATPLITNNGVTIWTAYSGGKLYVATQAGQSYNNRDVFIYVAKTPSGTVAAPWSKAAYVAGGTKVLGNEGSSTYTAWTSATASATAAGSATYMEGTLDVTAEFGAGTTALSIAVGVYGTNNAGTMEAQCPAAITVNQVIEANEFKVYTLPSKRLARPDGFAEEGSTAELFENKENTLEKSTELYQNTPNPFDNATAITFFLAEENDVVLRIADAQGREIEVLQNGKLQGGTHQFRIDATDMPSGLYFCTLQIGEQRFVRKMIKN